MTDRNTTRSLVYLNHFDMDGLITIARNGLETNPTQFTHQLIQRLAIAIVAPIAPPGGMAPCDYDADDPLVYQGRVALAIYPLERLKPLAATAANDQGGYDDENH